MIVRRARQEATEKKTRGQSLVEFALVIPIVVFVFMALIEVGLAFNAVIGLNRASQSAAHLAAIMGNLPDSDCLVLSEIEGDVYPPNDRRKIFEVLIERSPLSGNRALARQTYLRDNAIPPVATMTCMLPDASTVTLPYQLITPNPPDDDGTVQPPYPENERCPVLKGCPSLTPPRTTVDNIAVSIRYRHLWATPLNSIFDVFAGGDTGWLFVQRNVFRIEPVL